MENKCKNPSCTKEVVSIEGRRPKEFCSVECRTKFHNAKNFKGTGRGRPKGAKNKVKLPEGYVPFTDIGINGGGKLKFVGEAKVGVVFTDVNGKQDVILNTIEKPKWDFSNTVFLQVEDFTEYPKSKCPASGFERTEYLSKKKESDDKIREAYRIYKQQS